MSPKRAIVLPLFLATFLAGPALRATETWVDVRSDHFRVVTNAGESNGRHIAWQFEQIRTALEKAWPFAKAQLDRPVVVIAAKDELTWRQFRPEEREQKNPVHYAGYSWSAADAHYFLVRNAGREDTDVPEGENPYRTSYWLYGSLAMNSGLNWRLPYWFQRGLAGVLSNTIIGKDDLQTGRPIVSYVNKMAEGRFPLARILAITRDSPEMHNEVDFARVDAQAWGVVQYILFGIQGKPGVDRANALVAQLLSGTSSDVAVANVYGSVNALENAYWQQAAQGRFFYTKMPLDATQREASYAARPVKPDEVPALRGAWLASSRRPVEARAAIAETRKINPESPLAYEIEGRLLETEHLTPGAAQAFLRATELNSENFYPYFQAGRSLLTGGSMTPESTARARAYFERSIALNPTYGAAHNNLANLLAQAGQYEQAIAPARQAATLNPGEFNNHLLLARVLICAKHRDDALVEAKAAEGLARTDADRRFVQNLMDEIQRGG
jgi:tetratricopeptide (TPR) repeat protein